MFKFRPLASVCLCSIADLLVPSDVGYRLHFRILLKRDGRTTLCHIVPGVGLDTVSGI